MVSVVGTSSSMAHLTMLSATRIFSPNYITNLHDQKTALNYRQFPVSNSCVFSSISGSRPKLTSIVPKAISVSTENVEPLQIENEVDSKPQGEKYDWYSQWYPVMPVCDLDKRVPHGKRVMGLDVVVWWDRNESQWKVFNDSCPHRLAPLSEGRVDQWGRLQCVYHGWCFSGSGNCKLIPQASPDGPPVCYYLSISFKYCCFSD